MAEVASRGCSVHDWTMQPFGRCLRNRTQPREALTMVGVKDRASVRSALI